MFWLEENTVFSPTIITAEPTKKPNNRQCCFLHSPHTIPDFVTTNLMTAQRDATHVCVGQQSGKGAGKGNSGKRAPAG